MVKPMSFNACRKAQTKAVFNRKMEELALNNNSTQKWTSMSMKMMTTRLSIGNSSLQKLLGRELKKIKNFFKTEFLFSDRKSRRYDSMLQLALAYVT